jgi:rhamnosyltransferase
MVARLMASDVRRLDVRELASVTVTYNPDPVLLERQLMALRHVGRAIVVDNGSEHLALGWLQLLVDRLPWVCLERSEINLGLAAALNLGIAVARSFETCRAVLLLDQDSGFDDDAPGHLLQALNEVQAATGTLCCVGPALHDPVAGMDHGFHYVSSGWRWSRAFPRPSDPPFAVANLNGSGTTQTLELIDQVGTLDAAMFIDHIDTEWSFRVLSRGFHLFGIPSVRFDHRMGETGRRIWMGGWRVWPERSPQRHFYLFRNTVRLLNRGYVPAVWKLWAVAKMMLTVVVTIVIDRRRASQLRMMLKGIREGMRESAV